MKAVFIGAGNMGKPMAANLVKGGHDVRVFDADGRVADAVARDIGARPMTALKDIGDAEVIVTMLPDGHVVQRVALDAAGIADSAAKGTVVVDMSSSQPLVTRETGRLLGERGIALIDAPVSGGVERAVSGTLTIMIGSDDAAATARVMPVLSAMGNKFFEVGGLGAGHAAKALNNVVGAANYAVLAEAMTLGERYGIDAKTLVDIICVSTGRSFASSVVMSKFVLTESYATGFKLGLLAKDANIAAELAQGLKFEAPLMALTARRWLEARDALGANEDNSKAILAWRGD